MVNKRNHPQMALIQVGRDRKKLVALIQVSEILKITHIYIYISNFICYLDLDIPSGGIKHDVLLGNPRTSQLEVSSWENI